MKIGIFCNGISASVTDRKELVEAFRARGDEVYIGGKLTDTVNPYYQSGQASFLPIDASKTNTNPLIELKAILNIAKQVKKAGLEQVIIYGIKNHPSMAIGARLGGAKRIMCIVNGRGNLFTKKGKKAALLRLIAFPMLKIAYKRCSSVVCFQNPDDRDLFRNLGLISKKTKNILTYGSGVNLDNYPYQPLAEEGRFLFLSRITPSKGLNEYIAAARIVKAQYPETVFDIVGPLDQRNERLDDTELKKAVEDGVVLYHGRTEDVPGWMGQCRFFVYPSYYPEGVPRCILQAMSVGRPVITCSTPGCSATVEEGVNGFQVPPRDPAAIAEKMIVLLRDPALTGRMAAASRKRAEECFDVHAINQQIISALNG